MQRFIPERKVTLVLSLLVVSLAGVFVLASAFAIGFETRMLFAGFAPGGVVMDPEFERLERQKNALLEKEQELRHAQELIHVAFPQPTSDVGKSTPPCDHYGCEGLMCSIELDRVCENGVCEVVDKLKIQKLRTIGAEHYPARIPIDWDLVKTMTVHYEGWRAKTGDMFDSSYDRGKPVTFRPKQVIKGFAQGARALQRTGDKIRVRMDESLGYPGRPNLDGELIFDIELIDIEYHEQEGCSQ